MVDYTLRVTEPADRREDAVAVVRALRREGHIAYFAGGCVRDELLGLVPKDYDVATDAHPDLVRETFGHRRTQAVGAAFGVILVRQGRSQIEVATFRTDLEYEDGRRPSGVVFTNAEQDARRRDFTINGLFRDPLVTDPEDDSIIDHVGGKADLADRILRAIGLPAERFGEDYLRMLRAVRFASRFGLTIEPQTWEAIGQFAPRLAQIAPERVADELRKMLKPPTRGQACELLWDSGLLGVIFRTLPERVPDRPARTPVLDAIAGVRTPVPFGLALAALVLEARHAAGVPVRVSLEPYEISRVRQALRRTLRWSNEETDAFAGAMGLWTLLQENPPGVALMKRFLAGPHNREARHVLLALRFDPTLRPRIDWLEQQLGALGGEDVAPEPFVGGDDLVAMGLPPGPMFKRVLDEVYDAQLEARVTSRQAALEMAQALME